MTTTEVPPSTHCLPDHEGGIHFTPPLYRQRYNFTLDLIASDPTLHSLLDIGCGTCQLLTIGRFRNPHLQLAAAVDVVRSELDEACFRLKPLPVEYVMFRRETPLHIYVIHSDATKICHCFHQFDVVTLIEVIEHLYMNDLNDLVEHVFAHIRPRLVIVTTPNADFNVLFSTMICGQFRHADHKFEFTREEFQCWAQKIVDRYHYRVEFNGLGEAPSHEQHRQVGFCTQIAIFYRIEHHHGNSLTSTEFSQRLSQCSKHELIDLIDYPFGTAKPVELNDQIRYLLEMYRLTAIEKARLDDHDHLPLTISCQTLLSHPRLIDLQLSFEELRHIIESLGYKMIDEDRIVLYEDSSNDSQDEQDNEVPSSISHHHNRHPIEQVEESWD